MLSIATKPLAITRLLASKVLFTFFILLALSTEASVFEKLQVLDKTKTQDFTAFSEQLSALSVSSASMSLQEQHYLKFLQIYQQIYLTGYAGAIEDITTLLNSDIDANLKFRLAALAVNAHVISKDFRLAFSYADSILNSISQITDPFTLRQALGPVAMLFIDIGQQDLANYYIAQLRKASDELMGSCYADHLQFTLTRQFGQLADLNDVAQVAITNCELAGEILWRDLTYVLWTRTLIERNDIDHARQLLAQYQASALGSTYPILIAATHAAAAQLAMLRQDFSLASTHLDQALAKAQFNDANEALLWTYDTAFQLANMENRYQAALSYYIKYSELSRKLDRERADKQFAYELINRDMAAKNQSIELLNKDNELLYLQNNVYQQQVKQTLLLVAVLMAVLIVATVSTYRAVSERRRFKHIAEFDHLTGISNRYHFNNLAQLAIRYCENNGRPVAVILFDLDYFKHINDTYGHKAGDWALQAVVRTCRNFMRNNDVFGRIGGEEFAVVLPGCELDKAALLAEICRDAIAGIDTADSGALFSITASFGVSGSQYAGYQLKQLLADADQAMYQAKHDGRNQVATFSG